MSDITNYLLLMRQSGGSDLHLAVGAPPVARVDGALKSLSDEPLTAEACKSLVYAALTEAQRAKLEQEKDLDFSLELEGVGRFRGQAHHCRGHVEAAFRHIQSRIPDLTELGHVPSVIEMTEARSGLILVTGAAGMGKTTTLASMTQRILRQRSGVVISIEDPIEYIYTHSMGIIKQRQVGEDVPTFEKALRAAVREDPDVIVVSELRDHESIATVLTAAETGHLVIATMHAISAPLALERMIEGFPAERQPLIRIQLASCLVGIVSQLLLPRADQIGRCLVSEVLRATEAVRSIIRDGSAERLVSVMQLGASHGMHTLDESLIHLLKHGHITHEDAIAYGRDREYIQNEYTSHMRHLQKQTQAIKK